MAASGGDGGPGDAGDGRGFRKRRTPFQANLLKFFSKKVRESDSADGGDGLSLTSASSCSSTVTVTTTVSATAAAAEEVPPNNAGDRDDLTTEASFLDLEVDGDSERISTGPPPPPLFESDIGVHIGKVAELDDRTKYDLLEHPWTPPSNYVFPHCVVRKLGKDRKKYAQRSHLEKYFWLVFSDYLKGYLCKYCVLFGPKVGGRGGGVSLQKLVKIALTKFDDVLGDKGDLHRHENHEYHRKAVEIGKNFVRTFIDPSHEVINQLDTAHLRQVEENRARLRPIVKTIIFCGKNNIPLRGKNDSGKIILPDGNEGDVVGPVDDHDGNFRALLKFRVDAGDTTLKTHLESAKSNATYISPQTQNELIDCCKEEIQNQIMGQVKEATCYSIIFDETTDISHIEQISLSFRYVHNGTIREDFVTFANAYEIIRPEDVPESGERRLTGVALGHIVIDLLLKKFSVDPLKCVGVGTDNCSVMASDLKGAVQEIVKICKNAKRCPCNNHMLNSSLARTSTVIPCKTGTATIKSVIAFANASAKRQAVFKAQVGTAMTGLCETRWTEKHEGHLHFRQKLPEICDALETISGWTDSKTASDAQCLRSAITAPQFHVSIDCLCDVLGTTVSLSRVLQSPSLDLKKASDAIQDSVAVLKEKRANADSEFHRIFEKTQSLAFSLGVTLTAPRTATRQQHRANQPADSVEEYYRKAIYVPLLDNVLGDIADRFPDEVLKSFNLRVLLPSRSYLGADLGFNRDVVLSLAEQYQYFVDEPFEGISEEYSLWVQKWRRELESDTEKQATVFNLTVLEVLDLCDKDMYPRVRALLLILATLL